MSSYLTFQTPNFKVQRDIRSKSEALKAKVLYCFEISQRLYRERYDQIWIIPWTRSEESEEQWANWIKHECGVAMIRLMQATWIL